MASETKYAKDEKDVKRVTDAVAETFVSLAERHGVKGAAKICVGLLQGTSRVVLDNVYYHAEVKNAGVPAK